MFSTCVLLKSGFNTQLWSDDELKSLTLLYFKFDLFILSDWPALNQDCTWLKTQLKLQRVVADLNATAKVESFYCMPGPFEEWLGNVDVFVDFPDSAQMVINQLFPYRTYLELKDVLNPDFSAEVIRHDR